MPISTPTGFVASYKGDADHFQHVLDHLFQPAISKAGFEMIPPTAGGSEFIHGAIIRNLESANMVLVDMSTLNANVFYEFGIRTALDLPVCLVVDDLTPNIPFDTGPLHRHSYASGLELWRIEEEINKLTGHLRLTAERANNRNALWRHFGLTKRGEEAPEGTQGEKFSAILAEMESLKAEMRLRRRPSATPLFPSDPRLRIAKLRREIKEHDRRYYEEAAPTISDVEYDTLLRELQRLEEEYPSAVTFPQIPYEFTGDNMPSKEQRINMLNGIEHLAAKAGFSVRGVVETAKEVTIKVYDLVAQPPEQVDERIRELGIRMAGVTSKKAYISTTDI